MSDLAIIIAYAVFGLSFLGTSIYLACNIYDDIKVGAISHIKKFEPTHWPTNKMRFIHWCIMKASSVIIYGLLGFVCFIEISKSFS